LANHFEVPRIEAPALRPIVQAGATDGVHHRMDSGSRRVGGGCARPVRGNLLIGFLHRLWPAAVVVSKFIRREVACSKVRTRFEADYFEARLRQWQNG